MRPFSRVEAKITLPSGLSTKSGRRAPIIRYVGFIIVLNCGMKNATPKIFPE